MKIRDRLSVYFAIVSSMLLLAVLICVYVLFSETSREDFYRRLQERIGFAAGVYLEADEIPPHSLARLKEKFILALPEEEIRFYDSSNRSSFIRGDFNWNEALIDKVREAGYLQYQRGAEQVVGKLYHDNQGEFVIIASAVDVSGQARKETLIRIMASIFVLQLFIQLLAGRWFAGRILRPVKSINDQIQAITATDLHKRLDEGGGKDEINQLAQNFNLLLQRIGSAFDTHRMFIANASHELKTPLTGMIGSIEVALSRERSGDEYRQTLQSALDETERLRVIMENLLLLAYEENNTGQQPEPVRIDDMIWELREQFATEGCRLELRLGELPAEEDQLIVAGNKTLLRLALSNIIRNAFKYSGGRDVRLSLHSGADQIAVEVEDQGIGISAEALPNIFEPFYRAQSAKSFEGSGIGLYIAQRIVSLYKGEISVRSDAGRGSTFRVTFFRN